MTTIGKVMYWKGDRLIELQQELLNRTLKADAESEANNRTTTTNE